MKDLLSATLFQAPSIRRLLDRLVNDLANRRSLLVLLPTGIHPDRFWTAVRSELSRRAFWVEELSLQDLQENRSLVASLGKALGVHWLSPEIPRTIVNLMAAENLPDAVILKGLEHLSNTMRRSWITFLAQWAQASQNVADRGHMPMALCLIAPATTIYPSVPESNVYLAVHWWWGLPSALEVHLLCRLASESGQWDAEARWREHLLPALAGNDMVLAEYLWDDLHLSVEELTKRLQSFAQHRGWEAKTLRAWGADKIAGSSSYGHNH